jgi:hypothetical protein
MSKERWRLVEEVVVELERALEPGANVQHDVYLPVLGRPDREPRQCDIVITSGTPPREVISIVEVQARQSKPDIVTLAGWVDKMREVGAQRLICVSEVGFPSSMIGDVALRYGPTVKLMTLEAIKSIDTRALSITPWMRLKTQTFTLGTTSGNIELRPQPLPPIPITVDGDARLFLRGDDPTLLTLHELLVATLDDAKRSPETVGDHHFRINLGRTRPPTRLVARHRTYRVTRMVIHFKLSVREERVPLHIQGYRQEFVDGHVAWVTSGIVRVGEREVEVLTTVRPTPDGHLLWQGRFPKLDGVFDFRLDGVDLSI